MTSLPSLAPGQTVLETPRLVIRNWRGDDVEPLTEANGDPEVTEFLGGPHPAERTALWLEATRLLIEQNGYGHFALERKRDARWIGFCGLKIQQLPEGRYLELGYRLARSAWGAGLATEAACAIRDWAFERLPYGLLIAIIAPGNARSIRVAEKAGMAPLWESTFCGREVRIYGLENPHGGRREAL